MAPRELSFRWRGRVYTLPGCLTAERAAAVRERWPDGIVGVVEMLQSGAPGDPPPPEQEPMVLRRALTLRLLGALGETVPDGADALNDQDFAAQIAALELASGAPAVPSASVLRYHRLRVAS